VGQVFLPARPSLDAFSPRSGRWALAFLDPGGVAACSRWLSAVLRNHRIPDSRIQHPGGVPASCEINPLAPFQGPFQGAECLTAVPVVSQTTLNHRLHAAIPAGIRPTFLRLPIRAIHNAKPEKWDPYLQLSHSRERVTFRKAKAQSPRSGRQSVAQGGAPFAKPWEHRYRKQAREAGGGDGVGAKRPFARFAGSGSRSEYPGFRKTRSTLGHTLSPALRADKSVSLGGNAISKGSHPARRGGKAAKRATETVSAQNCLSPASPAFVVSRTPQGSAKTASPRATVCRPLCGLGQVFLPALTPRIFL